jgi:CRP-like cAMP-binding protein
MSRGEKISRGPMGPEDLRKLHFFKQADDSLLEALYPHFRRTEWPQRAMVSLQRHFPQEVGFAWSGRFRFAAIRPDNSVVNLYTVTPGNAFAFALATAERHASELHYLLVDDPGVVLSLPAREFSALLERSHAVSLAVNRALASLTLEYGHRIYEFATADIGTRLIAALLRIADAQDADTEEVILKPSPTHADLAAEVGASRETVTRALKKLEREGFIKIVGGKLIIVSLRELRALDQSRLGRRFSLLGRGHIPD